MQMKLELEYDDIIKNKKELIEQLESLKEDAIWHMQSTVDDLNEVFKRDLHALKIAIRVIKEMK